MTALTPFSFEGTPVRTVLGAQGQPLFVLNDVCAALDIANPHNVATRLSGDCLHTMEVTDSLGRKRPTTVVTEGGVIDVALDSRKPQARAFRRWITHEVVPSIRKHGGYLTPQVVEDVLSDPDTLIRLATSLKQERQARQALEAEAAAQRAQIEASVPKVLFADAVAASNTDILVGDLAKLMRGNGAPFGANRLFERLRADGYLIKRKGADWNMPTQRAMELGLFRIKETAIARSDGSVSVSKTPKVTGKGQQYFITKYLTHQPTPLLVREGQAA